MSDSFIGFEQIIVQPEDVDVGHLFDFTVNSSTTSNDGALAPGSVIASAEVIGVDSEGTTIPGLIAGFNIIDDTYIQVALSWPGEIYVGMAGIRFILHMEASSTVHEFDFDRINIKNIGFS